MKRYKTQAAGATCRLRAYFLFAVCGVFGLLFLGLEAFAPSVLQSLDNTLHDTVMRMALPNAPASPVVLVDIDEASLKEQGQWPWPRYKVAMLLDAIHRSNAKGIAVDILFAEPDRASIATLRQEMRHSFDLEIRVDGVPREMENTDTYLGAVFARTKAVGAALHDATHVAHSAESLPRPVKLTGDIAQLRVPASGSILTNTPCVQAGIYRTGFINVEKDHDASLRHIPLLYAYDGQYYPSLPLALFLQTHNVHELRVEKTLWGFSLIAGSSHIPIDATGKMRLRFSGPDGSHTYYSAKDILHLAPDQQLFAQKFVLVGSTAAILNDKHLTPVAPHFPGSEIQAVVFDNLLTGTHYRDFVAGRMFRVASTLCLLMLLSYICYTYTPLRAGFACAGLLCLFPGISVAALTLADTVVPGAVPAALGLTQLSLSMLLLYSLEQRIALRRFEQLHRVKQLALESMTAVAESRDELGGAHIKRTQHYVKVLALHLQASGNYPLLTDTYIETLFYASPLHDVGKVAIPDAILFKPSSLTPEEFAIMKTHVKHGFRILDNTMHEGHGEPFFMLAAEIVKTHHEKWNGTGYPEGLSGEAIPLSGRIMALADVYDALVSKRHYKPAFSHEKACSIILEGRGTHFDPAIVDAFIAEQETFRTIAASFRDATT